MKDIFTSIFNEEPEAVYFAPGRVNLIGEHLDYNGGHVLPFAIEDGTYGAFRLRQDSLVRLYSDNFAKDGIIEFDLKDSITAANNWADYIKGVICQLRELTNWDDIGFELTVVGTIPNGAGLSSSASLEVLVAFALNDLLKLGLTRLAIVKLCQKAENDFIGVACGIMDQFVIGLAQEDHALLLNTTDLTYEQVSFTLPGYTMLIMNSNKRRTLAESKYNERYDECLNALAIINKHSHFAQLCAVPLAILEECRLLMPSNLYKRAHHVISEEERVLMMKDALLNNDYKAIGALLKASHASLACDYEVTGLELDALVDAANTTIGVLGARMTGAGFGGCAIALVKNDCLAQAKTEIAQKYYQHTGYVVEFMTTIAKNGVDIRKE